MPDTPRYNGPVRLQEADGGMNLMGYIGDQEDWYGPGPQPIDKTAKNARRRKKRRKGARKG